MYRILPTPKHTGAKGIRWPAHTRFSCTWPSSREAAGWPLAVDAGEGCKVSKTPRFLYTQQTIYLHKPDSCQQKKGDINATLNIKRMPVYISSQMQLVQLRLPVYISLYPWALPVQCLSPQYRWNCFLSTGYATTPLNCVLSPLELDEDFDDSVLELLTLRL